MGEDKVKRPLISPVFQVNNGWRFKDFTVGMHIATQKTFDDLREFYLLLSLFSIQIAVGFAVRVKPKRWGKPVGRPMDTAEIDCKHCGHWMWIEAVPLKKRKLQHVKCSSCFKHNFIFTRKWGKRIRF